MAWEAICFLQSTGRRVAEDVAVVGFDDIQSGIYFPCPLSSFGYPKREIASRCVISHAGLFRGPPGPAARQTVLYVTERAVFALTPGGLELIEVAPGIDMASQVLDRMEFRPRVRSPRLMAEAIFRDCAKRP